MLARLFVFCLWALILLVIQAQQSNLDRQICDRLQQRCNASSSRLGNTDDSVDALNEQCKIIRGPQWRNINRCQMLKAYCSITLLKCRKLTCIDIEKQLR